MSAADQARQVPWKPKHNPWAIAVVVTFAAFMEILDTTVVNVALPHIAGSLSVSNDEATWALTSYLVANAIVLTISGWLSEVIGRKRYFMICLGMFTVCSILCGLATSLPQLVIFRLMQGFFGGGMQPTQLSIVLDTFPPEKRGAAFGVTAIATIVAPVLGPTLGGFITDHYDWRWIFFVNLPVGLIAVFFVSVLVEDPPWRQRISRHVDFIGLSLITLGLGCTQVMLDRGEDADWLGSTFIRIMAIFGAVGILGAISWLLIAKKPIVDLHVFKDKNFAMGCVCIAATGAVLYSGAVVIPLFTQSIIGYTATWSGLILSPGGIAVILLIPVVGQLMRVMQTRLIIAAGFFITGCAFVYSSTLTLGIDFKTLVIMRSAQTAGLAFLFVPISTIAYATLPRELNGDATALFTMLRNVFGSIGISVSTAMITERTQIHQSYLARWASSFHQPFNELIARSERTLTVTGRAASAVHDVAVGNAYQVFRVQAAVLAYSDVFFFAGMVAFTVVPFCFFLSAKKGGGSGPAH
ncbi:MAG: DHA2 family efflux MFS transporter permease subunit [Methylocella sp.]